MAIGVGIIGLGMATKPHMTSLREHLTPKSTFVRFGLIADKRERNQIVRFVPKADMALSADHFASWAARKASESFFSSSGVSLGGSTETVSLSILPVNVKGV
jgi:hypothetical protein